MIDHNELTIGNWVYRPDIKQNVRVSSNFFEFGIQAEPIKITEEVLVICGCKYYNGKNSGNLTMDFEGKLDVDFIGGELKIKSHYEPEQLYRNLYHVKYLHQLQNFYKSINGGKELQIDYKKMWNVNR